jgi:hypothetical protein
MIVGVQGSRSFDDYTIFLRAMGTALSMLEEDDKEFLIYSVGPAKVNSMAIEFANVTERSMKAKGIKVKVQKVPFSWAKENMFVLSYFAYFGKPGDRQSELVEIADRKNVEAGVYRY